MNALCFWPQFHFLGKKYALLFYFCFCKTDAFPAFKHIGRISCIEIEAEFVAVFHEMARINKLFHPVLAVNNGRLNKYFFEFK